LFKIHAFFGETDRGELFTVPTWFYQGLNEASIPAQGGACQTKAAFALPFVFLERRKSGSLVGKSALYSLV
jgi:hypothetical protein